MLKNALNWAGENRTVVGVLCGAVLVMYGFYRGSVRLMKFFFNVSDKQIFEMGFLVGLITAVVIIVSGVVTHRHLNLHIDDVRPTHCLTARPRALPHRPSLTASLASPSAGFGRPTTRPSGIFVSTTRSTRRWAASGRRAVSRGTRSSPGTRRSRAASGACARATMRHPPDACRWSSRREDGMRTACTPHARRMHAACTPHVHVHRMCMCIACACALHVHCMCTGLPGQGCCQGRTGLVRGVQALGRLPLRPALRRHRRRRAPPASSRTQTLTPTLTTDPSPDADPDP